MEDVKENETTAPGGVAALDDERRYQAAVQVGLEELPVIVREADDTEVVELALIENLQRKDLTPFEEAEALAGLADQCGYTHEDLARKLHVSV